MRSFLLAAALAIAIPALAHATVRTEMGLSESKVGANETYRLRVPSEKEMDTIELRLVVPVGLTVSNFEALPAWQRSVTKNAQGIVTEVTWKGGKIGESEYALFPFRAKNSTTPGTLLFKVYQKYSDGSIVAWDKEDKRPTRPPRKSKSSETLAADDDCADLELRAGALVLDAFHTERWANRGGDAQHSQPRVLGKVSRLPSAASRSTPCR